MGSYDMGIRFWLRRRETQILWTRPGRVWISPDASMTPCIKILLFEKYFQTNNWYDNQSSIRFSSRVTNNKLTHSLLTTFATLKDRFS